MSLIYIINIESESTKRRLVKQYSIILDAGISLDAGIPAPNQVKETVNIVTALVNFCWILLERSSQIYESNKASTPSPKWKPNG